jgi:EAL domain-containing protein (putative c-di-GMP-specific phosphodiesterase class I)
VFKDADLAPAIRRQIVAKVAADMRQWGENKLALGRIAVNFSSADFSQPRLVEEILKVLDEAQIPAKAFEIDIKESVLLGRSSDCISAIPRQFCNSGIGIALDDFGTGYASLMHLKHVLVNHVKVERTFVED